jgi:hypothetical protein
MPFESPLTQILGAYAMLIVELDDSTEVRARRAAAVLGKSLNEFVREAVEGRSTEVTRIQSLDVVLGDYVGATASAAPGRSDRLDEVLAQTLGESAEQ